MESLLQKVVWVIASLHLVCGVSAAVLAEQRGKSGLKAGCKVGPMIESIQLESCSAGEIKAVMRHWFAAGGAACETLLAVHRAC